MNWDSYTRQGLDFASSASSLAFYAARKGTNLGFSIARGVAYTATSVTGAVVDHTLFGGSSVASPILGGAVSSAISFAEQVTLAPLYLGEYITSTSLIAAHSSINLLSVIFPGSSEASFSLASFITLVRREWNTPPDSGHLPEKQYGVFQVAKAVVAWVALQGVTQEWQEEKWFRSLREMNVSEQRSPSVGRKRRGSRIRVTSDVIFPGQNKSQIIAADIGDVPSTSSTLRRSQSTLHPRTASSPPVAHVYPPHAAPATRLSDNDLKSTLRRLSKLVLAGYGGASLLFFGVSPYGGSSMQSPSAGVARAERAEEASQLAKAVDASEAEARGEDTDVPTSSTSSADPTAKKTTEYSWWDVLLGKHDHDIFQRAATGEHNAEEERKREERDEQIRKRRKRTSSVVAGIEHLMPRFWVLTDHARKQVVLVFRGTMSLNEIAVDLTCDPEEFEPAQTTIVKDDDGDEELVVPGMFPGVPFPQREDKEKEKEGPRKYMVHGGMLKMARAMGGKGKPVQLAVGNALMRNWEYDLVLCGHSLGAGVAGILGLMWADPETCLTVGESGLPRGRKVSVYCFAPPCLVDPQLSKLSSKLIVSLVYSHDVVSRLSLGSVRDLKNAAMWLCEGEEDGKGEGAKGVLKRVESMKRAGGEEDLRWYIALRKTLEANMHMADLFPPGRVLWALRDSDLHVKHRSHGGGDKLRLFEVLDVEKVFEQIVFARDMLSAHMPHQYDRVLHDLL